jgi:protein required for attachment to host cells
MPQPDRITWTIVANAEHVRVFEERPRGADLHELVEWDRRPTEDERRHADHQRGVQKQRFGYARGETTDHDLTGHTEHKFLHHLAHDLRTAGATGSFESLILLAPPKALGVLRGELGDLADKRVEDSEACDCVEEKADAIQARVHRLREQHLKS